MSDTWMVQYQVLCSSDSRTDMFLAYFLKEKNVGISDHLPVSVSVLRIKSEGTEADLNTIILIP
jgi:hypothetical protein